MKNYIVAVLLSLCVVATAFARPALIGHRGSYWGVENSAEAFIAGAEAGYQYLETDVKVAGDGTFILIHDDDTERLGGNLDILSATIDELKAETYTQTRGGVTYTGKICTLEEYLQICKDYGCIPFIELKWADGINNNDCSNLGRMVETVIEYGFGDEAIINTSMRNCLKYVRDNYPDFKLMFLCNTNWESNFDWCVENNIGAYIQTGCFDKETVVQFHEQDLPVGVWTVNTEANYKIYGNYGCDFIAVDYLKTDNLPELDPFAPLVPNRIDYPDHRGIVQEEYAPELEGVDGMPADGVKKVLIYGDKCYQLKTDGTLTVLVKPAGSGGTRAASAARVAGGVSDIALSADGVLFAAAASADGVALLRYGDEGFSEFLSLDDAVASTPVCVSGASDSGLYVYYMGTDAVRRLEFYDEGNGEPQRAYLRSNICEGLEAVALAVSPFDRDNVLVKRADGSFAEYSFDREGLDLSLFMDVPEEVFPVEQSMIHPFRYGAALYALSVRRDDAGKAVFRMVDITGGFQSAEVVSQEIVPFEDGGEGYLAGFGDVENGFIYLYLYDSSAGLARYVIEGEEPEGNIGEVDFRLEKLWSFTDNEGNAPEHIDGTNAQQGGAYKGYFYINDCADKLIYVYGKDGLAGTLPGGSGWGAACDDAGNVIVRDDKNAGNSHILMIYPSGVMPGDDVESVRLEFDLLDSGQTNFISASGDVLGDGGYVYFYPNGQTVVNMVEIANGEVVDILRSGELSIVSSTAGYVIPYRNNPENWLYMVRNNGIYEYNGTDAGLLVGGSSTRPPLRNSTCGAEYFLLSSHEIVIYNSGANYKGGFTIKDLTENVYVESVSPIGSKGYEEGGNYSVSNWMFAEKIDAGSYYLYQYCPANGIAVYRFWDANYVPDGGVEAVAVDERLSVYPNPVADVLHIDTAEPVSDVAVYSMSGAEVLRIDGESVLQIDVSGLPAGMYVLKVDGKVARFVKKF